MDLTQEYNFTGQMQEIPDISVDKFKQANIENCELLFITHCHSDHMIGLYESCNQNLIVEKGKTIYGSPISRVILQKSFPVIADNVQELDLKSTTTFTLRNNYHLSVTPIPASHCPGSVMFLFELNDRRILVTGDYRITSSDLKKFKVFYDSLGELKPIDKIYLDTTFFLKKYDYFPRRQESLLEIKRIIGDWIKEKGKAVQLHIGAKYGYEYLFLEIYKYFGMPIHVSDLIYSIYSHIPEMDRAITKDFESTQIHCSCGGFFNYLCYPVFSRMRAVRKIKITALVWENIGEGGISTVENERDQVFRVCYSTHASFSEGMGVLRFLKPKSIFPCVRQKKDEDQMEMVGLLDGVLKEIHGKADCSENKGLQDNVGPFLFNIEDKDAEKSLKRKAQSKSPSKIRGLLDSP